MALVPFCAFAVDDVVLINQSTVNAAGGFPYTIIINLDFSFQVRNMVETVRPVKVSRFGMEPYAHPEWTAS